MHGGPPLWNIFNNQTGHKISQRFPVASHGILRKAKIP